MLHSTTLLYNLSEQQWRMNRYRMQFCSGTEDVLSAIDRISRLVDLVDEFVLPNGTVNGDFSRLIGSETCFEIDFDERLSVPLGEDNEVFQAYRAGIVCDELYRHAGVDVPIQMPLYAIRFSYKLTLCFALIRLTLRDLAFSGYYRLAHCTVSFFAEDISVLLYGQAIVGGPALCDVLDVLWNALSEDTDLSRNSTMTSSEILMLSGSHRELCWYLGTNDCDDSRCCSWSPRVFRYRWNAYCTNTAMKRYMFDVREVLEFIWDM